MEIDILGIDLAKRVFQLHGADRQGRAVYTAKVTRAAFLQTVRESNPRMVAIEACGPAHHWARCFLATGIQLRLVSPQYVRYSVLGSKRGATSKPPPLSLRSMSSNLRGVRRSGRGTAYRFHFGVPPCGVATPLNSRTLMNFALTGNSQECSGRTISVSKGAVVAFVGLAAVSKGLAL